MKTKAITKPPSCTYRHTNKSLCVRYDECNGGTI